jgi:hypothetical protein
MSANTLPPPIDIDSDTKKAIIEGLKAVLALLQKAGVVDQALTYQTLIATPAALETFIAAFVANRQACDSVVKAKDGNPVRDDDQMLVCNVSLNQIQQLLVRTCAKKLFESQKTEQTVTETVTKKALFGLIKKTEQVEVTRIGHDPAEERKLRQLAHFTAYGWQLPLLNAYRQHLTYPQIIEIGEDILALKSDEAIASVGRFGPDVLKKVKAAAGPDFVDILVHRPQAIAGVAVWNRDMYDFYRKTLGDKAWDFFARDKAFFNVVASIDKTAAKIFGDVLCYVDADNLEDLQRLNLDKLEVLITSMKGAFGDKLQMVMGNPNFGKDILRKVVDNLLHMNQEKDKLMVSFGLTCKAMVPTVNEWLARQHQA